ncbi:MAG: response regulator [Elusimicrobia bacterium]|nr:response regulator [Elusimicrobiota bacterium]
MNKIKKPVILIIDDDKSILVLVEHILSQAGYKVISVDRASKVQKHLKGNLAHLILLDIMMPDMDGYTFCAQLKQTPNLASIPVVFFSSLESEVDKAKAFSVGAADYVTKSSGIKGLPEIIDKNLRAGK